MERKSVSQEELLEWINSELSKHEECNGCRFTSVMRLSAENEAGCNWTSANLRCSGVPADVCYPISNKIIAQAEVKFNIK